MHICKTENVCEEVVSDVCLSWLSNLLLDWNELACSVWFVSTSMTRVNCRGLFASGWD